MITIIITIITIIIGRWLLSYLTGCLQLHPTLGPWPSWPPSCDTCRSWSRVPSTKAGCALCAVPHTSLSTVGRGGKGSVSNKELDSPFCILCQSSNVQDDFAGWSTAIPILSPYLTVKEHVPNIFRLYFHIIPMSSHDFFCPRKGPSKTPALSRCSLRFHGPVGRLSVPHPEMDGSKTTTTTTTTTINT